MVQQRKRRIAVETIIVAGLLAIAAGLGAQSSAALKPIIDNQRVTVWDLTATGPAPDATLLNPHDSVLVYLTPESIRGHIEFVSKGISVADRLKSADTTRAIIISLKDGNVPQVENTSGYPDAFPRPGNLKKLLDNARVTVWEFTFAPGQVVPMHFHAKDFVPTYLSEGTLLTTTPDGQQKSNDFTFGAVRFNTGNLTHSETISKGEGHVILTELK